VIYNYNYDPRSVSLQPRPTTGIMSNDVAQNQEVDWSRETTDLMTNSNFTDTPEITREILTSDAVQQKDMYQETINRVIENLGLAVGNAKKKLDKSFEEKPMPEVGGFTEEGLEQEVEKFVAPTTTDKQTEEVLTDAEITDIASSAIDSASDADEVQPTDGKDFDDTVKDFLELNEGNENEPYKDSEGNWTVGIGHYIGKTLPDRFKNDDGNPRILSDEEVQTLFEKDYKEHKEDASSLPMYNSLDNKGKQALIDLTFNMGSEVFNENKWPKFFDALGNKDLKTASKELKNSKWYNQVNVRAPRVIKLIEGAKFN